MTDAELNALVFDLDHAHPDDIDCRACSAAITTLRAQLAEARAELHGPIKQLSAHDHANIIAHLSLELEPNGVLPNRNSLMMALVEATNAARKDAARADRAEAALAAQIEADAEICTDIMSYDCMKADGETYQPMWVQKVAKGMVSLARQDIRDQPHDRTALDRYREKVLREAADMVRSNAYTTNGGERSLEPVAEAFVGMDMHHETVAGAILALIEKPDAS